MSHQMKMKLFNSDLLYMLWTSWSLVLGWSLNINRNYYKMVINHWALTCKNTVYLTRETITRVKRRTKRGQRGFFLRENFHFHNHVSYTSNQHLNFCLGLDTNFALNSKTSYAAMLLVFVSYLKQVLRKNA